MNRGLASVRLLLGGRVDDVRADLGGGFGRLVAFQLTLILLGAGLYGAAMGWWRSPLMAAYNFVKFPLVILATTMGNALLNGMLAPLLGVDLRFRDSLRLVLMSCALAAVILGGFAPLMAFLVWNAPPLRPGEAPPEVVYRFIQLAQVAAVAFAGVIANVRLFRALESLAGTRRAAGRVLFAWLAGNLFFGSQLCWILRPLIGSPNLPVQFLRPDALNGNFYETVFHAVATLLRSMD